MTTKETVYDANIRKMQSHVWSYWRRIQFGKRMSAKRHPEVMQQAKGWTR